MSKFITRFCLTMWCALEIVGSVFVGYWLLTRFATTHTLLSKIGFIGLFLILVIITVTFTSAVFLITKDKDKSKKLDKLKE